MKILLLYLILKILLLYRNRENLLYLWNYRIVKRNILCTDPLIHNIEKDVSYSIHEVYYVQYTIEVYCISENPIILSEDFLSDLQSLFKRIHKNFTLPILDYDKIIQESC